jgi:hypothetical protein
MKHILILIALVIMNTASAQKVYLTREGVQRLTKRLNECNYTKLELVRTKIQMVRLVDSISIIDSTFKADQSQLESRIQIREAEYKELQTKYNKVLALVPKRKQKQIK